MTVKDTTPQSDTLGPISFHHPAHLAAFEVRQVLVAEWASLPSLKGLDPTRQLESPLLHLEFSRMKEGCILLVCWLHEA